MDTDVIIVGAGPTGLMLALELRLAGAQSLVLERQPQIRQAKKAGGLNGQILDMLHYRGIVERFGASSSEPPPPLILPFGGVHVDFTHLPDPPMDLLLIPQPEMEAVQEELALEHGAEIRRGHTLIGLRQDDRSVAADVRGPDGEYQLTAAYLVGCDGGRSPVRELAGIPFPGSTYPEIQRLAVVAPPQGVTLLAGGDIEVEGYGRIPFGFTPTERGVFALGSTNPELLGVYTAEEEERDYDDDDPMTPEEMRASIQRVLGVDLPLGEASRLTRFTYHARHAERYRDSRVMLAGDAAHLFPAGGIALNAGMSDSVNLGWKLAADVQGWAPPGLLDTYHEERHLAAARTLLHTRAQVALKRGYDPSAEALRELFQELVADEPALRRIGGLIAGDARYPMPNPDDHALTGTFVARRLKGLVHTARPVLLDFADRSDFREAAQAWEQRVDVQPVIADDPPAEALLIRPDGYVVWAADAGAAVDGLREALAYWFGEPS